ncbi:DUF3298 and DUF4163 domain-containing protein [Altibacter sp. HG106]|uniref:DUF3298 and DUF4163 domain-containing protein n=1 Tax=Altibacter sp. HG106 TaxID=3023937 RepID=UPI002350F494|nr:DUF3298 and DUF4163 domain-containing protein [Altibacter sp. HG106]MDC7994839.1 DUF4163 domain-containing protein [Altibacter sp. HG106]
MFERISLLFLLLLLLGCADPAPLSFENLSFSEEELAMCTSVACPEISLQYIQAEGSDDLANQINQEVEALLINALHIGDPDEPITATHLSEAAQEFVNTYRLHVAEFPDMPAAYAVEATISERFQNDQYLSLEANVYTYTGGAHGYGSTSFLLFDKALGTSISFPEVIADWEAFEAYVETAFRKAYELSAADSINANGFWFEKDQFYIPKSIGFTSEGVLLIYNPYEIASYAEGAIELSLPWKDIEPYLKTSSL